MAITPPHHHDRHARGFQSITTAEQWRDLLQHGHRREFAVGAELLHQGAAGTTVYALTHGRTQITYSDGNGTETLIAIRGPGDLLGEYAQRDRSEHMASVKALERCVATVITAETFEGCIRRNGLGDALQHYMLDKARQVGERMWRTARLNIEQRIAKLFLELIEADPARSSLAIPMTQEQVAASLGISRKSVANLLGEWKRGGLVRTQPWPMTVLDLPELVRKALPR